MEDDSSVPVVDGNDKINIVVVNPQPALIFSESNVDEASSTNNTSERFMLQLRGGLVLLFVVVVWVSGVRNAEWIICMAKFLIPCV